MPARREETLLLRSVPPPDKWLATDLSHVKKIERRISTSDFTLVPFSPETAPCAAAKAVKNQPELNRRQVHPRSSSLASSEYSWGKKEQGYRDRGSCMAISGLRRRWIQRVIRDPFLERLPYNSRPAAIKVARSEPYLYVSRICPWGDGFVPIFLR